MADFPVSLFAVTENGDDDVGGKMKLFDIENENTLIWIELTFAEEDNWCSNFIMNNCHMRRFCSLKKQKARNRKTKNRNQNKKRKNFKLNCHLELLLWFQIFTFWRFCVLFSFPLSLRSRAVSAYRLSHMLSHVEKFTQIDNEKKVENSKVWENSNKTCMIQFFINY